MARDIINFKQNSMSSFSDDISHFALLFAITINSHLATETEHTEQNVPADEEGEQARNKSLNAANSPD